MDVNEEVKLFRTALYAGEIMVKSGSETYRAEDTIKRMLASKGFLNSSNTGSGIVYNKTTTEFGARYYIRN